MSSFFAVLQLLREFSSKRKIVSNDTLESSVKVPAALNLPFGQMFFGFNVTAYTSPSPPNPLESEEQVIINLISGYSCLNFPQHSRHFLGLATHSVDVPIHHF